MNQAAARWLAAVALLAFATGAHAQWSVVNLHPPGARYSFANCTDGHQQGGQTGVGTAGINPADHACIWAGSAASWQDVHPSAPNDNAYSVALSSRGGVQVGEAEFAGINRASMWTGTASSWVDLTPPGASRSEGRDGDSNQQVGWATIAGDAHVAVLWHGTGASWINLNPVGATGSVAHGIDGAKQVGEADGHAGIWNGTAESWIDLNPGFAIASVCNAASEGHQVGRAAASGFSHAALWNGTRASFVDLNPVGTSFSEALAVHNGRQAGYITVNDLHRAALWSGTAASFVDLHALLPPGYDQSEARGVWDDGVVTQVVGYGRNATTGQTEAMMWVARCLTAHCPADFNCSGTLSVQDLFDYLAAYFGGEFRADFNHSGTLTVQDIFDFLAAYFTGCG